MMDHRSTAIITLCTNLRSEALQEKMTLTKANLPPGSENSDNNQVQQKVLKLLSILEPLLFNEENIVKAVHTGLQDTLCDMLVFQSQNMLNI